MKVVQILICFVVLLPLVAQGQQDSTKSEPLKKYGQNVDVSRSTESTDLLPDIPLIRPKSQVVDGELWIPYPEKYVEAGFFPEFVGNGVWQHGPESFPGLLKLSQEDAEIAEALNTRTGYADPVLFSSLGRVMFLKGKPLAFFVEDLVEAGYDPDNDVQVTNGLIDLFHIKIEIPGYEATLPEQAKLHLKYIDHDYDGVLNATLDLNAKSPGDYYFASRSQVLNTIRTLYSGFEARFNARGHGRELKFVNISGFDESTVFVTDLPHIEGAVMTHEIFIGSFQAESGWQWFGRPEGLFQSQQPGFVQQ